MRHRISEVDETQRIATCSVCGPGTKVRAKKTSAGTRYWQCKTTRGLGSSESRKKRSARCQEKNGRRYNLKRYGLTPEEYDLMLLAQDGRCLICRGEFGQTLPVDHCHRTGKVRGLLCHHCNRGIGLFGDDPERLRRARSGGSPNTQS